MRKFGVPFHALRCMENFAARGRPRWEEEDPQRAADIRALVEPHTQADPELRSARRYTNLTAAETLELLRSTKGYAAEDLPCERSMRAILNRMGYRLKRIQKAKPLKKTPQTDAIFANVKAVHEQAQVWNPGRDLIRTRRFFPTICGEPFTQGDCNGFLRLPRWQHQPETRLQGTLLASSQVQPDCLLYSAWICVAGFP